MRQHTRKGFTLIELLVVIAIIAILAVVVVLTLNPIQLLAESRDSTRMSDMKTLDQAISLYQDDTGGSIGSSTVLYLSIPDPAATSTAGSNCASLGLPPLPTGWTYHCAASSTYRNVNGQGWLPLNLTSASFGTTLGTLPVDPTNTTSSGLYYTYATNGTGYEVTMAPESTKYAAQATTEGQVDPAQYAEGSSLAISPFAHGMVGYWPLNEGAGTTADDDSGSGNNGTISNATWQTTGCENASACLLFNGTSTSYVMVPDSPNLHLASSGQATLMAWVNPNGSWTSGTDGGRSSIITKSYTNYELQTYGIYGKLGWSDSLGSNGGVLINSAWQQIAVTFNQGNVAIYLDGNNVGSLTGQTMSDNNGALYISTTIPGWSNWYYGYISKARVYNRALSSAEIQAMYNAQQ